MPGVVLTRRRLPADSCPPGQTPAQDARSPGGREPAHVGAGLGDDHVDREAIEAGNGEQRLVDRIERGGAGIDLLGQRRDRVVEEVEVTEDPTTGHGVVRAEVAGQRFCERRDLRSHLALGQRGESRRVLLAGDQCFDHRATGLGQDLRRDRGQLDAGVLKDLLEPLDLGDPGVDLGLAVAGQLTKLSDRQRRHEARPDHPVGRDVGQPLGIGEIGLASGDFLDVPRVAQPDGESPLQRVEHGLPIDAGGLHRDELHVTVRQPSFEHLKSGGRGGELLLLANYAAPGAKVAEARDDAVAMHVQAGDSIMDLLHCCLLPDGVDDRPAGEGPW